MEQGNFEDALDKLDRIGEEHELYQEAQLNKLLCFCLQGSQEKVRLVYEEISSLDLAAECSSVAFLF
jgi:hypothetical protein